MAAALFLPTLPPSLPPALHLRLFDAVRDGALDRFIRLLNQAAATLLSSFPPSSSSTSSFLPPSLLLERPSSQHHGRTLLVHACYYNKGEIVRYLIDRKGARVEATTRTGTHGGWEGGREEGRARKTSPQQCTHIPLSSLPPIPSLRQDLPPLRRHQRQRLPCLLPPLPRRFPPRHGRGGLHSSHLRLLLQTRTPPRPPPLLPPALPPALPPGGSTLGGRRVAHGQDGSSHCLPQAVPTRCTAAAFSR